MSLHNCVHLYRIISSAAILLASISGANAAGDAAKGRTTFQQCQLCHSAKKSVNKEGPSLYGVIGRPAGNIADYPYSDAMKASAEKGLIWTTDNVRKYLSNPHQFFVDYLGDPSARNKMVFILASEQDREDVVAYLQSLRVK
jgi:cytochrome c